MEKRTLHLKPIAIWMIIGGLITLSSAFMATFYFSSVGTTVGFVMLLAMFFVAAYEMGAFQSLWIAQEGEWNAVLRALAINFPFRLILIWLLISTSTSGLSTGDEELLGQFLIVNIIALAIEMAGYFVVYRSKPLFMPSKEEIEEVTRRIHTAGVRTLSECPKCKDLIEPEWCCCPSCGTSLPRFCAQCNAELNLVQSSCPSCGALVARSMAIMKLIETLKETAEMPGMSETRSMRYARYAEGLLKGGQLDEAIEAYKKAIEYSQFTRKKTNFMVKMATVYGNSGMHKEAMRMLDDAIVLDREDWAGAKKKRDEMLSPQKSACTSCPTTA